ncbi:MAG: trans-splicing intein-formed DNA polymerase III subunit alpha N-terminal partner DnaE-N, partial [Cyanobacteria bacterium P01_A01_bin.17]
GLIPKFINRKHGREQIDYPHELVKPILTETYGIMVYQEQIMKIAQDMAGYSLGQADLLRRAMGKKKIKEMEKHREIFIEGAAEKGVDKKVSEALFEQMVLFAEYCLSGDTPVLTEEYGYLSLKEIVQQQIDCHVFSQDASGHIYAQPIAQWHHRGHQELFEYELEDGSVIRATRDHRFMVEGGAMIAIDQIYAEGLTLKQHELPAWQWAAAG